MMHMRKLQWVLLFFASTLFYNHLQAQQDYKFGIGLRFSTPGASIANAVSIKYFMNDRAAIEALISYNPRFGLGALYELHQQIGGTPGLNWFYGFGAYFAVESNIVYSGPMGITGIDYKFPNAPVNLSLDWKPELDIAPAINFVPGAFALSARFTLK
jgi:hypothetical protein